VDFAAHIDFSFGQCTLTMDWRGDTVASRAYRLHRSFDELTHAVGQLAEGVETTSCRWVSGELAGGVFLDFVADPGNCVNIAVHEFLFDETAREYQEMWSAVRGPVRWHVRVPRTEFLLGFVTGLRRARVLYADETGYLEHWGGLFPDTEFQRLSSIAHRLGYQPASTGDIRDAR
jgi:hypothetical protein